MSKTNTGAALAVSYVASALRTTLRAAPTTNVDHILSRARHAIEAAIRDAGPEPVRVRSTVWDAIVRG